MPRRLRTLPAPRHAEPRPPKGTEQHHERRLYGVHGQRKDDGLRLGYAIEHKHGFHGKMPRAGTVGGGHDDGNGAHDERDQRTGCTQMGSGVETEECEVVMEKVTAPDGKGEKNEQWHVAHVLHGDDSRPQTVEGVFHLIIYTQSAQDEEAQNDDRYGADNGHPPACFGKVGEYLVEAGACAVEEIGEDRQLPQKRDTRDDGHECGVDGSFGNHSA